jgi:hypothetical protein
MHIFRTLAFLFVLPTGLVSCSDANFAGESKSSLKKTEDVSASGEIRTNQEASNQGGGISEAQAENADKKAEILDADTESPEEVTPFSSLGTSECAKALDGLDSDIVRINNDSQVTLTPNSIVFLKVSGLFEFDLSNYSVSKIKGICIEAAGQATIKIDTNLVVDGIYYYARGTATAEVDFGSNGNISKITTDISGTSSLSITGDALDCGMLNAVKNGAGKLYCNQSAM